MKRLLAAVIAVLLIFTCCAPVFSADAAYDTAGELYRAWHGNMPDYICGVWSTDGESENLTFGILNTDAGEAGKQEILDLIRDDTTVTFVYQKYSHNELLRIQNALYAYMQKDLGLVSFGLREAENRIEVGIHEQRADDAATKELVAELTAEYGDALHITYVSPSFSDLSGTIAPTVEKQQPHVLFAVAVVIGILLLTVLMLILRKKRRLLLQTNTGALVTAGAAHGIGEIAGMVKQSNPPLPSDLDDKVMDAIKKMPDAR